MQQRGPKKSANHQKPSQNTFHSRSLSTTTRKTFSLLTIYNLKSEFVSTETQVFIRNRAEHHYLNTFISTINHHNPSPLPSSSHFQIPHSNRPCKLSTTLSPCSPYIIFIILQLH